MKKILTTLFAGLFALAIVIPSSANAASDTYTVQRGDTMWKISRKVDVNFGKLVRANPQIDNPSLIYVGQDVRIPGSANSSASENNVYTVQNGDTMWKISQRFNVGYDELLDANPQIENPSVIYVGEPVQIPGQNSQSGGTTPPESKSGVLSQYEKKVIQLTNKERTERGLQPLKVSVKLSKMAGAKAKDMRDNNYFAHKSPTYGSPFDMMTQFGISYSYAGENIAAGQPTPKEVVNAWMNSAGHRKNILNSNYTYIGLGYAKGGSYGSYWAQEFISK